MISSLSFLIFATDVLSLFSLFSFARGSSFLLIYLKRHPSVLLIFSSFVSCIIYCCRHAWEPLWLATAHLRRLGLRGASVTGSSRAVVGGQLGRGLSRRLGCGGMPPGSHVRLLAAPSASGAAGIRFPVGQRPSLSCFPRGPTRRAADRMVAGLGQSQQELVSKTEAGVCPSLNLGSDSIALAFLSPLGFRAT